MPEPPIFGKDCRKQWRRLWVCDCKVTHKTLNSKILLLTTCENTLHILAVNSLLMRRPRLLLKKRNREAVAPVSEQNLRARVIMLMTDKKEKIRRLFNETFADKARVAWFFSRVYRDDRAMLLE